MNKNVELHLGDCLEVMAELPENSVDTILTDPPYGLTFMGKDWDRGVPGVTFWREALRVAKPGAMLLAMGGTRTFHRLVCAIEDAGWEVRDSMAWLYGSGFPKSYDISKGIDKKPMADRVTEWKKWLTVQIDKCEKTKQEINDECGFTATSYTKTDGKDYWSTNLPKNGKWKTMKNVIGISTNIYDWVAEDNCDERGYVEPTGGLAGGSGNTVGCFSGKQLSNKPISPAAKLWHGWGTALKPAMELICVAMKPIDGTYVNNALTWGVAGLWIDGGRVAHDEAEIHTNRQAGTGNTWDADNCGLRNGGGGLASASPQGRFPANVIHDGSEEVLQGFPTAGNGHWSGKVPEGGGLYKLGLKPMEDKGRDGLGSAARFFYCAKSSRRERDYGLDGTYTVKYNYDKSILGGLSWKDASTELVELLKRVMSGSMVTWNTGESGESITGLCPLDSLSTTLTEINKITTSQILDLLMRSPTSVFIRDANLLRESGGSRVANVENSSQSKQNITKGLMELVPGAELVVSQMLSTIKDEGNWKPLNNFHSTVKPLALMRYLARLTKTPTGGVVLDPFMGSGTTGIACVQTGRNFIGIEIDPTYFAIAEKRIAEAQMQPRLLYGGDHA